MTLLNLKEVKALLNPTYLNAEDQPCVVEDAVATRVGNLRLCRQGGPLKQLVDGVWVVLRSP